MEDLFENDIDKGKSGKNRRGSFVVIDRLHRSYRVIGEERKYDANGGNCNDRRG